MMIAQKIFSKKIVVITVKSLQLLRLYDNVFNHTNSKNARPNLPN